jgi:hypothetical protein
VDRLAFSDSARLAFGFWYGGEARTIRAGGGDIGEAKGVSARGRRDEAGEEREGDDPYECLWVIQSMPRFTRQHS